MKKALRIACIAFWICTCFGGMALAKEYRWNANSVWPPNNHLSVGLEEFSQKVAEKNRGHPGSGGTERGSLGIQGTRTSEGRSGRPASRIGHAHQRRGGG